MKRILTCVGARPNMVKITQLHRCFSRFKHIEHKLVHTGQHTDPSMSDIFFKQFNLHSPDFILPQRVGQPISLVEHIEREMNAVLLNYKPDLVLVPGDVDSSFACAKAAHRLNILIGHIESGLRSRDLSMPEEVNRILIDEMSDLLFVTEASAQENLLKEGKSPQNIFFVGNTMIDTLLAFSGSFNIPSHLSSILKTHFAVATFHRQSNVDQGDTLTAIVDILIGIGSVMQVVFPVHPRTRNKLNDLQLLPILENNPNIILLPPLSYFDFMGLVSRSALVLTDSGGLQEETTFLQIPCLTLRPNTERPCTLELGTNTLMPLHKSQILEAINHVLKGNYKIGQIPPLWDGHATERLVNIVVGRI